MSQNDFVIANQAFPATRADLTSAFQAAASNSSGALAPTTTYANMMWYDTTANILKIRSEADDAWISIGYLDQSANTFKILDDTIVATTAGVSTGLLGDQTTGAWQTGTGTTESLVSPAKVKASVIANAPSSALTLGTFTAASGNTFLDFSVPTTATEIHLNWYDLVMSNALLVQLLVGGVPVTSGYYSSSGSSGAESSSTTGFYIYSYPSRQYNGVMNLTKASSSVWMETHASTASNADVNGAGRLTGAGTVNGVRFLVAPSSGSFSAGQVSVSYR